MSFSKRIYLLHLWSWFHSSRKGIDSSVIKKCILTVEVSIYCRYRVFSAAYQTGDALSFLSNYQPGNLSTCRTVNLSPVNLSTCRHVNLSTCQTVNMSTCQPVDMCSYYCYEQTYFPMNIFLYSYKWVFAYIPYLVIHVWINLKYEIAARNN